MLAAFEYSSAGGSHISVVGEYVPGTPFDVLEPGQGDKVLDQWATTLGALAEADRAHLGHRAKWLTHAAFGEFNAGDKGGGYGSETHHENAEASISRGNLWGRASHVLVASWGANRTRLALPVRLGLCSRSLAWQD